tara:strand:- start:1209 stop:1604 length:396 start_codon:yes stop_codon:yes gene_type:complete
MELQGYLTVYKNQRTVSFKSKDDVINYISNYRNQKTQTIEKISNMFFKVFFEEFIKDGTGLAIVLKSEEYGIGSEVNSFISRLIKELLSNQKTILDNEQYSEQINTIRVNIISKLIESIPDMKRRLIENQN